jgi:hypothetical protein
MEKLKRYDAKNVIQFVNLHQENFQLLENDADI